MTTDRGEKPTYVYLMESAGLHKVGVSVDPMKREDEYKRTANPYIRLVTMSKPMPRADALQVQRRLHDKLYPHRVRGVRGEWFELDPDQSVGTVGTLEHAVKTAGLEPGEPAPSDYNVTPSDIRKLEEWWAAEPSRRAKWVRFRKDVLPVARLGSVLALVLALYALLVKAPLDLDKAVHSEKWVDECLWVPAIVLGIIAGLLWLFGLGRSYDTSDVPPDLWELPQTRRSGDDFFNVVFADVRSYAAARRAWEASRREEPVEDLIDYAAK